MYNSPFWIDNVLIQIQHCVTLWLIGWSYTLSVSGSSGLVRPCC